MPFVNGITNLGLQYFHSFYCFLSISNGMIRQFVDKNNEIMC